MFEKEKKELEEFLREVELQGFRIKKEEVKEGDYVVEEILRTPVLGDWQDLVDEYKLISKEGAYIEEYYREFRFNGECEELVEEKVVLVKRNPLFGWDTKEFIYNKYIKENP